MALSQIPLNDQVEQILDGDLNERDADPRAVTMVNRYRASQPLTYPNKPDAMGGGPRPRGPTPVGPASLSGGMVGAPSAPISPDESMINDNIRDMDVQIQSLQDNGLTPASPRDPRFGAEDRIYNRKVNPYKTPDDAATDRSIAERRKNSGEYDLGRITDEDRADERSWQQFANASPGSQTQATYDPRAYAEYENRVTENRRAANARERVARQQELDQMSPEEYQEMLDNANTKNKDRQENRRIVEVMARTGRSEREVAKMTPEQRERAMLLARAGEAQKRRESYQFQAQLGGGTANRETARIDALLSRLGPVARERAMAQLLVGGRMGPNEVEAAGLQLEARQALGNALGRGGVNDPVARQAARQQERIEDRADDDQRVIEEDANIGERFAPLGNPIQQLARPFGFRDDFEPNEQREARQILIDNYNYSPIEAENAVRRMARERGAIEIL